MANTITIRSLQYGLKDLNKKLEIIAAHCVLAAGLPFNRTISVLRSQVEISIEERDSHYNGAFQVTLPQFTVWRGGRCQCRVHLNENWFMNNELQPTRFEEIS